MAKQPNTNAAMAAETSSVISAIQSPEFQQALRQAIADFLSNAGFQPDKAVRSPSPRKLLRVSHIVGNAKIDPPIPALVPISRAEFLAGVKSKRYPQPVKLSPRVTVWYADEIAAFIDSLKERGEA